MKAGCRRRPSTSVFSPEPHPPSPALPIASLSPKANTSASAACRGKSLPAELDRSPAALPPPRQHPSLTRSLPLPALPLTLTPSARAEALPEWAAGAASGWGRGDTLSLGPQSCKAWLGGWTSRDSREQGISGHLDSEEVRE